MGLQNLVGISLEQITPAKETVKRLLDAAARHIADAKVDAISAETRFTSAYTAVRMLADVGCCMLSWLPNFDKQARTPPNGDSDFAHTLGVDSQTLIRLDKLRKQRNLTEYTGDLIPESAVAECLSQAQSLHAATLNWLKANKGELL